MQEGVGPVHFLDSLGQAPENAAPLREDRPLANTKSAEKAARQAERHRERNVALRSQMRTEVRKVTSAIAGGDRTKAQAAYREAVPVIDSLVTKGMIHRNKAARHKSRLSARIRQMTA